LRPFWRFLEPICWHEVCTLRQPCGAYGTGIIQRHLAGILENPNTNINKRELFGAVCIGESFTPLIHDARQTDHLRRNDR
jgi:hypothetical protein